MSILLPRDSRAKPQAGWPQERGLGVSAAGGHAHMDKLPPVPPPVSSGVQPLLQGGGGGGQSWCVPTISLVLQSAQAPWPQNPHFPSMSRRWVYMWAKWGLPKRRPWGWRSSPLE